MTKLSRLQITAAFVLAAAVITTVASATAPGTNGPIGFRRYFNDEHSWGAIFTINPNRTGERQITHPSKGFVDDHPEWSPDGSLIAFFRCPQDGRCAMYTVGSDGSGLAQVSACPPGGRQAACSDDNHPAFSPDGRELVFGKGVGERFDIAIVDRQTREQRVVVRATSKYNLSDPQFAPDGRRLLFVELSRSAERARGVFVAKVDGSGVRRVTPTRLAAGDNPDWSPDGKWILFRSNEGVDEKQSQIYVIRADGTHLKQLTHFRRGTTVTSSSFSPDGRSIVFGTTGVAGNADVFVMTRTGKNVRPVTRTRLWDSAPDWGPAP